MITIYSIVFDLHLNTDRSANCNFKSIYVGFFVFYIGQRRYEFIGSIAYSTIYSLYTPKQTGYMGEKFH